MQGDPQHVIAVATNITKKANAGKSKHIAKVLHDVTEHEVEKHDASFATANLASIAGAVRTIGASLNRLAALGPETKQSIPMLCSAFQYMFGSSLVAVSQLIMEGKYEEAMGIAPAPRVNNGTAPSELNAEDALAEVFKMLKLSEAEPPSE